MCFFLCRPQLQCVPTVGVFVQLLTPVRRMNIFSRVAMATTTPLWSTTSWRRWESVTSTPRPWWEVCRGETPGGPLSPPATKWDISFFLWILLLKDFLFPLVQFIFLASASRETHRLCNNVQYWQKNLLCFHLSNLCSKWSNTFSSYSTTFYSTATCFKRKILPPSSEKNSLLRGPWSGNNKPSPETHSSVIE